MPRPDRPPAALAPVGELVVRFALGMEDIPLPAQVLRLLFLGDAQVFEAEARYARAADGGVFVGRFGHLRSPHPLFAQVPAFEVGHGSHFGGSEEGNSVCRG